MSERLKVYTPFQKQMAEIIDRAEFSLPDIDRMARLPPYLVTKNVIWSDSKDERHILPVDDDVPKMIRGGIQGAINELAHPYIEDEEGHVEKVESEEGHEIAYDILEEHHRRHPEIFKK